MAQLFLLRHAKAGWAEPGQRDFDRALTQSGQGDAANLGRWLRDNGRVPGAILASSSARTRQTVEALATSFGRIETTFLDELYEATAAACLALIRAQAPRDTLMLVGHNPVMEDLTSALLAGPKDHLELESGFPTCALAILSFGGALKDITPGTCRLDAFIRPRDLK